LQHKAFEIGQAELGLVLSGINETIVAIVKQIESKLQEKGICG